MWLTSSPDSLLLSYLYSVRVLPLSGQNGNHIPKYSNRKKRSHGRALKIREKSLAWNLWHFYLFVWHRARRDYWEKLKPASGRPLCSSMSSPDSWGVTKGHAELMQQKEATSKQQLKELFERTKTHWFNKCRPSSDSIFTLLTTQGVRSSFETATVVCVCVCWL